MRVVLIGKCIKLEMVKKYMTDNIVTMKNIISVGFDQGRQGDVLLKLTNKKLKGEKIGENKYTVAFGEKTGNHHDIVGNVNVYKDGQTILVVIGKGGAVLEHQEHAIIDIFPGIYEVVRQRESTLLDEIRIVRD